MELLIRKITIQDNLALAKIIRDTFKEHDAPREGTVYSDPTTDNLYDLFQTPKSILWVAELNNEVIGCCGVYPTKGLNENCAELVKFYLSRYARGKGIGKELMEKCILSAKEYEYTQLYLESLPQFSNAVKMYEKEGFVKLNNPLVNSEHKTCSIWMLMDLK
jgi:putative acetyltransferase